MGRRELHPPRGYRHPAPRPVHLRPIRRRLGILHPYHRPLSNNPFSVTSPQKMEEEIDNFTAAKASRLAQPLVDANVPFKIHIVKDHDMKERLCLEVERLGLSAVIMGSRGIGALRRSSKGKLGSVSDYCVQHCACPVVVVREKLNVNQNP
ncbi:hypothetical protein DH2020_031432 [Rehmannia glutinosa]|uniref:UspA domain-containing protein n=1 Tax=Rehmannia glutinosa TaxID=99300 RepID=A0ABR0VI45_REHGL